MSPRKKIRKARLPFINFDIQTNTRQLKVIGEYAVTLLFFVVIIILASILFIYTGCA